MKLIKLQLKNFAQHAERTIEFSTGVNGLVGRNGAGKSNAMSALSFALTGRIPNSTKERKLRRGESEGDVSLHFEHGGHVGVVTRQLHTSKSVLEFSGTTYRKSADIDKVLSGILGIPTDLLSTYVIVGQGEVSQVLFSQPSVRLAALMSLFGLDRFETIRSGLGDELRSVPEIRITAVEQDICSRIKQVKSQLEALSPRGTMPVSIGDLRRSAADLEVGYYAAVTAFNSWHHPQTGREALLLQKNEAESRLIDCNAKYDDATFQIREVDSALVDLESSSTAASQSLLVINQSESTERQRQSLLSRVDQLSAEEESNPEPVMVECRDGPIADLHLELLPVEFEITRLRGFIKGFSAGSCPTCGTAEIISTDGSKTSIPLSISAANESLKSLVPFAENGRREVEDYTSTRSRDLACHLQWKLWKNGFDKRVDQVAEQLSILPAAVVASGSEGLREIILKYKNLKSYSEGLHRLASSLRSYKDIAVFSVCSTSKDLERFGAEPLNPDEMLLKPLQAARKTLEDRIADDVKTEALLRESADLDIQLAQYQTHKLEADRVNEHRAKCTLAYETLHRESLPAALAKRYFKSLNKNWNELLSTLDVRFSVQIGDDTSIRVTFPDGEAPIEDLSGGERCCAALAFIMAVNRQFASSAGFLILDEPTYGLDADHRDKLLDLLKSARTYTDSSGLQLMMITHEDGLRGGFNNLIDLNP